MMFFGICVVVVLSVLGSRRLAFGCMQNESSHNFQDCSGIDLSDMLLNFL